MFFCYTDAVRSLIPEAIYNLGIKAYLEGIISSKKPLLLDNWREYKLTSGQHVNFVKIPILHLTLNQSKFSQASEALNEVVSCDCEYYSEFGVCKHIVAVCHNLENEYFGVKGKKEVEAKITSSILDNIFAVENESKVRKLQSQLESYFAKSPTNNYAWWEGFLFDAERNPSIYSDFMNSFVKTVEIVCRDYDMEKKLLGLVFVSLRLKGVLWIDFWINNFDKFSSINQDKLVSYIFRIRSKGLTKEFDAKINNWLGGLDDDTKQRFLDRIQLDNEGDLDMWLDYVISSRYERYLIAHLDKFDCSILIDLCLILDNEREGIEIRIMNQVKRWSDFLVVGDYSELESILTKWSKLGRSDYFLEGIKYIKMQHAKKTKLMSFIRRME